MTTFKKFLALALALLMMAGAGVGVVASSAAEAGNYDSAINYLAALEVFKGYDDGKTHAEDNVQRYQMALFFVRALTGVTDDANWDGVCSFTDVKSYGGAIGYVENLGIINGVGDGKFAPNDGIRYQDALVMAVRALGYGDGLAYPYGYITKAIQLGLTKNISGVNYSATLTRGETAQVILNVLNTPIKSEVQWTVGPGGTVIVKPATENTYLKMNFNTSTDTAVLTNATAAKNNCVDFNNGYVNVDKNLLDLGAFGSVKEAIGHNFQIVYKVVNGKKVVLAANAANVAVFENFGQKAPAFSPVYNGKTAASAVKVDAKNVNLITIGDVTYTTVDNVNYDKIELVDRAGNALTVSDIFGDLTTLTAKTYVYGQIALEDTDFDGTYDVAVYTPYEFFQITSVKALDADGKAATFVLTKDDATGNYKYIGSRHEVADVTKIKSTDKINEADAASVDVRGTFANGDYALGYYDNTNDANILYIAATAAKQSGRLTTYNKFTVTIGGTRYNLGFGGDVKGHTDVTSVTGDVQTVVNNALAGLKDLGATEANVDYVVLNGRVVVLAKASTGSTVTTAQDHNFVILDANFAENKKDGGISIDANGNLSLYAFSETAGYGKILISAIYATANDTKLDKVTKGDTVYSAARVWTERGDKGFTDYKGYTNGGTLKDYTYEEVVDFVKALTANGKVFSVMQAADGTYVLNTNLAYAVGDKGIASLTAKAGTYTFKSGIVNALVASDAAKDMGIKNTRIVLDDDAAVVLVCSDGTRVIEGVPANGTKLVLTGSETVYAANSKLIVIKTSQDLNTVSGGTIKYTGSATATNDKDFFLFIAGSGYDSTTYAGMVKVNGNDTAAFDHKYVKVLNLKTMALETVVITSTDVAAPLDTSKKLNIVSYGDNGLFDSKEVKAYDAVETAEIYASTFGYTAGKITAIGGDAYGLTITDKNGASVGIGDEGFITGGYKLTVVYTDKDGAVKTAVVTDASTGDAAKIFKNISTNNAYCAYKYNKNADSVEAVVFVPAATSNWN